MARVLLRIGGTTDPSCAGSDPTGRTVTNVAVIVAAVRPLALLAEAAGVAQLNVASPLPAGLSAAPERRWDVVRVSGIGHTGVIRCGNETARE